MTGGKRSTRLVVIGWALCSVVMLGCEPPARAPIVALDTTSADSTAQDTWLEDGLLPDSSLQDSSLQDSTAPDNATAASDTTDDASGGLDAETEEAPDDVVAASGEDGDSFASETKPSSAVADTTLTADTSAPSDAPPADTLGAQVQDAAASAPDAIGPDALTSTDSAASSDSADLDAGAADVQSWPPWSADAWSGPVKPVSMAALPKAMFTDITATFGLNAKGRWAYCAAVGFVDGDNTPDAVFVELIATPNGPPTAVIRALRIGPTTSVVTSPFNTSLLVPDGGCALADFSGDGFDDLVVGGSAGLAYYRGDGQGKFVDVSAKLLPAQLLSKVFTIAVDDFNGDGRLDLYLGAGRQPDTCLGVSCAHSTGDFLCLFNSPPLLDVYDDDRLLLQQKNGAFTDATSSWKPATGGIATSVASWDMDGDGLPEVLVGDDFGSHRIYPNVGGKAFGVPVSGGFHPYAHAMGWGIGDLNGDGATDLVVADVGPLNVYAGEPGKLMGPWLSLPIAHPIMAATWFTSSWIPQLVDLDQDGDLDIYLGVTTTNPQDLAASLTGCKPSTKKALGVDLFFRNDGGFQFTAYRGFSSACGDMAALAQSFTDVDGDGDLDLIQVRRACGNMAGEIHILRNDMVKQGGAVLVRLVGPKGNRDAIGAQLHTSVSGQALTRRVVGSVGMGSSGMRRIHLGLGKAKATGPITVTWPGGKKSQFSGLKAGSVVTWKAP